MQSRLGLVLMLLTDTISHMKTFKVAIECYKGEVQGATRTHKKEIFHNQGSQEK